jgi:hypothetical protein
MRPDGNKFQRSQALPCSNEPHSDSLALLPIGDARGPRGEAVHPAAACLVLKKPRFGGAFELILIVVRDAMHRIRTQLAGNH